MKHKITIAQNAREARAILRTPNLRQSLYDLARYTLGHSAANPYAAWGTK